MNASQRRKEARALARRLPIGSFSGIHGYAELWADGRAVEIVRHGERQVLVERPQDTQWRWVPARQVVAV